MDGSTMAHWRHLANTI